jgi:hypothetical protein
MRFSWQQLRCPLITAVADCVVPIRLFAGAFVFVDVVQDLVWTQVATSTN